MTEIEVIINPGDAFKTCTGIHFIVDVDIDRRQVRTYYSNWNGSFSQFLTYSVAYGLKQLERSDGRCSSNWKRL